MKPTASDKISCSVFRFKRPSNVKIGRPVIGERELQFKNKFLKNEKRFQIETQLMVNIYEVFHKIEVEVKGLHNRAGPEVFPKIFEQFNLQWLYAKLVENNKNYYTDKQSLQEHQIFEYTSIIDVCYMFKMVRQFKRQQQMSDTLTCKQIFLLLLFHFDNQKLVNQHFLQYYMLLLIQHEFQRIMFNGPSPYDSLVNISTLIVLFALEILEKEEILIEKPSNQILNVSYFPLPALAIKESSESQINALKQGLSEQLQ